MESLGRQSYSRKEKSLGLLVSNFVNLYNRVGVDLIGLDDAAIKLGVERRRIYDVVNIVESIGLVTRKGKNQYSWLGFGAVRGALDELKEEGMREKVGIIPSVTNSEMALYDQVRGEPLKFTPEDQDNLPSPRTDGKKEKCLWVLAKSFVKLLLCSNEELITLDGATKALLSDSQDPMTLRTKVRRLYDVANVFSSMNLIEKTHIPSTRKLAYRWLGYEAISESKMVPAPALETLCDRNEPKKRAFGTEITNLSAKRSKTDSSEDGKPYGYQNTSFKIEQEESDVKPDLKSLAPGPVTPAPADTSRNNNMGIFGRIERLSSTYRPQYCNPAIFSLFGHFKETWDTWHEEARKN